MTKHKNASAKIVYLLLAMAMMFTMFPVAVSADETGQPVCRCETKCTGNELNEACPVCGAEGAQADDCTGDTALMKQPRGTIAGDGYSFLNGKLTITSNAGTTAWQNDTNFDGDMLETVEIVSGVTAIEDNAFAFCTGINEFIIADTVTSIGEKSFQACRGLDTFRVPNGVTVIEPDAFVGCDNLTSVIIPGNVKTIGRGAFGDCIRLTDITISEGVTTIGEQVFRACTGLTSVTFPASVTSIGGMVFIGCSNLKTAIIKNSVPQAIGTNAFFLVPSYQIKVPYGTAETYKKAAGWTAYQQNIVDNYIAVTDIQDVPETVTVGTSLALSGTVVPSDAIKQDITWTVKSAGSTGAQITNGVLSATDLGDVTVTATVENGTAADQDYTQDFTIEVVPVTYLLTINDGGTGASVGGEYEEGDSVTIHAGSKSGYTFAGWELSGVTADDLTSTSITFEMPANDVTATAKWNSNGGSSAPLPELKPTQPVSGTSQTAATVDEAGIAAVTITEDHISAAVKLAQDAAAKRGVNAHVTVIMDVTTGGKDASGMSVQLSRNVLQQLVNNQVANISVVLDNINLSIGLNLAAVQEILRQANDDVLIKITPADASGLSDQAKSLLGGRPVYHLQAVYADGTKQITSFGNGSIKVAIPYTLQADEFAGNLSAIYASDDGKASCLTNSSYDGDAKVLRFAINHFSVYGVGSATSASYADVTSHWAKEDITFVTNRGFMSGTSQTAFAPDSGITRSMLAAALGKLAGVDTAKYGVNRFADIPTDADYAPYANWAYEKNLIKGVTENTFSPAQVVSRQEMAEIMRAFLKAMNSQLPQTRVAVDFADADKIADSAKDAVKQLQETGLINGKDSNLFDPAADTTRGEFAAVLHRYLELMLGSSGQGWTVNDSGSDLYYRAGSALTGAQTIDGQAYIFNSYGETKRFTPAPPVQAPEEEQTQNTATTHKIVKGDTLWALSRKYGCTVNDLMALNQIKNPKTIRVGTVLQIPQK